MSTGNCLVSSSSSSRFLLRKALTNQSSYHNNQRGSSRLRLHLAIRRRTDVHCPIFFPVERQVPVLKRWMNGIISHASFMTESAQDRSALQYEFYQLMDDLSNKAFDMNYEELKKTREELEEKIKKLVEKDIYLRHDDYVFLATWQKLMSRCGTLGTLDGAELTEKYLATVLNSNLKMACLIKDGNVDEHLIPVTPSKQMYTTAMDAWAKVQKLQHKTHDTMEGLMPARRAKQILDFMWEEYHSKPSGPCVKPDIIHYTTLLQALANVPSNNAVQMAQNVLKEVERLSGLNDFIQGDKSMAELDPNLVPDRTVYNTVLYCLSRYVQVREYLGGRVHSVQYIMGLMNDIMNKMELLAEKLNDNSWMPNTRTYNMLLMACSRQAHGGGKEAEKIVGEMLQQCQRYVDDTRNGLLLEHQDLSDLYENSVLPNIQSYNNVINAWSHDKTENAPERAESILKALLLQRNNKSLDGKDTITSHPFVSTIHPDIVTFNLVLNAWASSCQLQSGERAERLLNFMTKYSSSGENNFIATNEMKVNMDDLDVEPDVISYNSAINAWSKSGHDSAAYRAETLLNRLISDYKETGRIVPNAISFCTAIQACSKTSDPRCGERAEEIFGKLVELYQESGDDSLKPTESCYSSLASAHCNQTIITSEMQSFDKAVDALNRLQSEGGHERKTLHYNMILSVPSKMCGDETSKFDIAMKAKSILFEMQSNNSRCFIPHPDIFSFNNVIRGFQNYEDERRRRESLFCVLDVFNMLCEDSRCEPNYQTYIQLLKAVQSSLADDSRDRAILCEEIFRKCCESGLLTNGVLKIVQNMLPRQSIQRIEACKISFGSSPLTVNNLPPEWSDNRRVGQNQRRNR